MCFRNSRGWIKMFSFLIECTRLGLLDGAVKPNMYIPMNVSERTQKDYIENAIKLICITNSQSSCELKLYMVHNFGVYIRQWRMVSFIGNRSTVKCKITPFGPLLRPGALPSHKLTFRRSRIPSITTSMKEMSSYSAMQPDIALFLSDIFPGHR